MKISDFDYELPDERIAKFPLEERDASKLLVWRGGDISETRFRDIASVLPAGSLLVFNNTRVVRARLVMHRASGARIELLCLEPVRPADYERAFAARGECEWCCMVGGLKKWGAEEELTCGVGGLGENIGAGDGGESVEGVGSGIELRAVRVEPHKQGAEQVVRFSWSADLTFGQLLEALGRVPIPPYLGREEEAIDRTRYQTVYARSEGSVAAPTAGLHFTPEIIAALGGAGISTDEVTLHVGAGTFLPVKTENALEHPMHTEHFEVKLSTVERLLDRLGHIVAVGTTSVRTLESLAVLGWRIAQTCGATQNGTGQGSQQAGVPELERTIGQFEPYDIPAEFDGTAALGALADHMRARKLDRIAASTRIMITPAGYRFRIVDGIVTNFHQPKSTLLLLVSAFTGGGQWRRIYDYALAHDFRFLSYGDSSLLLR